MTTQTFDSNKAVTWRLIPLAKEFYDYDWECSIISYECPSCKKALYGKDKECSNCGQKLLWE